METEDRRAFERQAVIAVYAALVGNTKPSDEIAREFAKKAIQYAAILLDAVDQR